ncbi:APC family permease [Metallosphaera hakonensis]|uniref:APC family permease n=1 Tax=Metallosphaera hakonensis JCM 8857 = DSM 7519 TaxID=1293036 RepID=A0A2U9IQV2_9CREN|nr:APC family permease [Metallosphaera hakonensis]AWR98428.1 APC family permease [Metallosphaera hakonensis JCM 8857 = DSM 7519]
MATDKDIKKDVKGSLFARESSGLVREINWLTAMFISMGFIAFYVLPISYLTGLSVSPDGLVVLGALLSWIVLLPHSYLWTKISEKFQRTAADYVFASRALHPAVGVGAGLVFGISQMIFDAAIVYDGVGQLQTGFSALTVNFGGAYSSLASALSDPFTVLLIGALTFTGVILINIFLPKYTNHIMGGITIVALITFILAGVLMHFVTPSSITSAGYNYASITSMASNATPLFSNPVLATIGLMVFTASFLPFVNGATSVAGEVRGGSRAFRLGVLAALVLAGILITVFIASSISSLGSAFFVGAGVGMGSNPSYSVLLNPIFDVIVTYRSLPLDLFLVIGSYFWYLAIMFAVALFVSRYFMAIAFDKAMPTVVSYVSDRFHSPVVAHLIDEVITIGSLIAITVTPLSSVFFYGMDTADAMALLFGFIVVILASIVAHLRRNGMELKGRRSLLLGVSLADLIVMSIYGYFWFGNSTVYLGITMDPITWGIVASPFIAGIVIYYVMRWYRLKNEGIDIKYSFKEIPPE